jgi:hypothetical protein
MNHDLVCRKLLCQRLNKATRRRRCPYRTQPYAPGLGLRTWHRRHSTSCPQFSTDQARHMGALKPCKSTSSSQFWMCSGTGTILLKSNTTPSAHEATMHNSAPRSDRCKPQRINCEHEIQSEADDGIQKDKERRNVGGPPVWITSYPSALSGAAICASPSPLAPSPGLPT